jgi:peptide/nickel transport system permease protein
LAVSELGSIADIEGWTQPTQRPFAVRVVRTLWNFARRKPLGAFCGLIVIFFVIVGDLVPETINKVSRTLDIADRPVPYVIDILEKNTGIVQPYGQQNLRDRLADPSTEHLLGTDSIGRDIFSRLLYGARTAVMVSFGAVFLTEVIALIIGMSTAYYGKWVDKLGYRVVDVFDALPDLIVLITILGIFGTGLWQMIFVIAFLQGPPGSRIIRGQAISVMASPFLEAGRVLGAGDLRLMLRYILPNIFALVILASTLRLGRVVLLEASLSFLGYGLPPPYPSWGQMLSLEGREYMRTQPGLAIYPGLAIGLLVFSYNLFGDALRDVLDPRLRGSR